MSGSTLTALARMIPNEIRRRTDRQDISMLCLIYQAAASDRRTDLSLDALFLDSSMNFSIRTRAVTRPRDGLNVQKYWDTKMQSQIMHYDSAGIEIYDISDECWAQRDDHSELIHYQRMTPDNIRSPNSISGYRTTISGIGYGTTEVAIVSKYRTKVGRRTGRPQWHSPEECYQEGPIWQSYPIEQLASRHQILVLSDQTWPGIVQNDQTTLTSLIDDVKIAVIRSEYMNYCSYPAKGSFLLAAIAPYTLHASHMKAILMFDEIFHYEIYIQSGTVTNHSNQTMDWYFNIPTSWIRDHDERLAAKSVRVEMFTSARTLLWSDNLTSPRVKLVFENVPIYHDGNQMLDWHSNPGTLTIDKALVRMTQPSRVEVLTTEQALELDDEWENGDNSQHRSFTAP